jgi:DNA-binding NtrC family response regulator
MSLPHENPLSLPSSSTAPSAAILVVDDDAVVLDALCAQLACDGWEVTACTCASDALAALRGKEYATIISDQNMPEMKGLEFLTLARDIQPSASRLLITGVLTAGTLIEAINHGEIYRFIAKPWTRAELLVCVRNAIQRWEMEKANERLRVEVECLRAELMATQGALKTARSLLPEEVGGIKLTGSHSGDVGAPALDGSPAVVHHKKAEQAGPSVLATYC